MPASEFQFLDTNILIYAYDSQADTKAERSQQLLEELWLSKLGCISIQVLQEFYAGATGKTHLDSKVVTDIIAELSAWKVHSPVVKDVLRAVEIQQNYHISFWDALIVNSASQSGCAILWTEDLSDGQVYEGVRVQNPFIETG
jgi:predicted nucleic acid-binding protein